MCASTSCSSRRDDTVGAAPDRRLTFTFFPGTACGLSDCDFGPLFVLYFLYYHVALTYTPERIGGERTSA